jgi:hypothetical protein
MTDPRFFGYGSLVNLATHDYADPRPAHLTGWRRVWRHTTLREVAFLSVEPAKGVTIAGIVAAVPGADWAALDQREAAYSRADVSDHVRHDGDRGHCATYHVTKGLVRPASASAPILLSYLDTVVQGFHRVHGPDGVRAFFETTTGWGPIRDDRADPVYPRAQALTRAERALVDDGLSRVSVRPSA